jgi:predicted ATPase
MITLVEVLNFRCFRYIRQPIRPLNVLVGPNATGKTTFLDVLSFIKDVVSNGPDFAISQRSDNIYDLFWHHRGNSFELAIEAAIPNDVQVQLPAPRYSTVRYEIKIGIDPESNETGILGERVFLKNEGPARDRERTLFPEDNTPPALIYNPGQKFHETRNVIHKVRSKNDNYYAETYERKAAGWIPSFKFGIKKSALGNLPDDGRRFPVSTWLRQFFTTGVQDLILNGLLMRKPSPPGQPLYFKSDGSNIPWVIARLRHERPNDFRDWIDHVRTAIPDIHDIKTVERDEDRHRYLVIEYVGEVEVPSWMVSDGTLRFLALTLLAYLPDFRGTYLIEEPENGIHPRAVEALFQSLSSVYDAQVLLATHSPVILSLVAIENVLCFAKCGASADIVGGPIHPALRDWRGEASLGTLFAAGVLG